MRVYGNFRGASVDNPSALGAITAFVVRPVQDHNEVRRARRLLACLRAPGSHATQLLVTRARALAGLGNMHAIARGLGGVVVWPNSAGCSDRRA